MIRERIVTACYSSRDSAVSSCPRLLRVGSEDQLILYCINCNRVVSPHSGGSQILLYGQLILRANIILSQISVGVVFLKS